VHQYPDFADTFAPQLYNEHRDYLILNQTTYQMICDVDLYGVKFNLTHHIVFHVETELGVQTWLSTWSYLMKSETSL